MNALNKQASSQSTALGRVTRITVFNYFGAMKCIIFDGVFVGCKWNVLQ